MIPDPQDDWAELVCMTFLIAVFWGPWLVALGLALLGKL